ncbi:alpha/beta hydrolase [Paraglaciecola aquimarina]|uniref:Alpha/beta hydrolase n=1 Tax=Paraglaciecola algarum TaxID=3050085 RepID=A0ABS9DBR3_9ALTE|nr:alpha/beta hydrolase [Paraglaciecola sp. G1-23]MCF2949817.1 alpha/beta hydrolase [Paraglaciecola sp. G1-23]
MSRHFIAKKVYLTTNMLEAKIARLSKYVINIDNLDVTYLSSVKSFSVDKPILLLLHGFSGDKYVWNRLAKNFSADYQLLIPDLKGHGETQYSENDFYSVPSQCSMLIKLLNKLHIETFSVVGNSMGGMIAAKFIEQISERIEKCVLIDPAGAKSEFVIAEVQKAINPFNHCTEQDFFDFYSLLMAKPPYVPKFILQALAADYIQKSKQHAIMFEQFYTLKDFFPTTHRFSFDRTMLIWGMNDQLLPIEDYQQWKAMLNGRTQIYEDLGHLPMIEDSKRVADDILNFLRSS